MPVAVVKADYFNTRKQLERLLGLIEYKPQQDVVLIKPNAASAYGHYLLGDYTSPQIIESFINLFPDKEYIIAEGSAVGMKFPDAARLLGYTALEKKYKNVRLMDLENSPRRAIPWKFGEIQLPEIVFQCEYVNMPKMKTHNICTVTLGMKNQKGLLNEKTKKKFHWMNLHQAIAELANVVSPSLTIMDGIIAMEGNGPNSVIGKPKLMGVMVAGRDLVEVDNACIELMGIPIDSVKHVAAKEVMYLGTPVEKVRKRFKPPEYYNGMTKTGNSYFSITGCSGCLESLSGGLRGMVAAGEIASLPRRLFALGRILVGPSFFYIGRGMDHSKTHGIHFCVGDCARKLSEQTGYTHIPGCPPSPESIRKALDDL